jgi:hypothetical protein
MSDSLLDEYKAYYLTRAEKYAGNPNFPNYYAAEKRLSDAMQSCAVLEEFKDKIGDLNERCANALTKDQYIMEQKHFEKHKEEVRVLLSKRVLEKVDSCSLVNDLITMVTEEANKNMIEISCDEANRYYLSYWDTVDASEVYANAVVPDKYKANLQRAAEECRQYVRDFAKGQEEAISHYQKGWKLNPDVIMEHRHRRLFPYSDEHILDQLARYKKILNR